MSATDDILGEFLIESYESLDDLDRQLLALEGDPRDRDAIAGIFRTIHTIKGTCGFLGLSRLESVTHVGESLLSRLRDGVLDLDPEISSALLAMVDAVRELLAHVEATGEEGDADHAGLVATLTRLQDVQSRPAATVDDADDEPERPLLGQLLIDRGLATSQQIARALAAQVAGDRRQLGEILVAHGVVSPDVLAETLDTQKTRAVSVADTTVRVDVELLDRLMNLVGELVLTRNEILQLSGRGGDAELLGPAQRLDLITTELHEGVMRTRMQPVGNVLSRFPRVARDLAVRCGKEVRVVIEGSETELDKTILEAIKDPLTHLVRNAVDHGIETTAERVEAGKPATGTLRLRAYHEGGHVNIELSDDGGGLDLDKIRERAVDRGVITAEQATRMSACDLWNVIFLPGFSTADQVTNVSGRGVGMDVVQTNIERIGGAIDVQTEPGGGTTFRVSIPLTLAIIPALIVTTDGDQLAIPQGSLVELVRLEGVQARAGIEYVHGAPVHRLRGKPLTILDLGGELRGERVRDVLNIAVLQADSRQFGLILDEVHDTREIVVKPLGTQHEKVPVFAGTTTMGDGRVALILDVLGLAERARVLSRGTPEEAPAADEAQLRFSREGER